MTNTSRARSLVVVVVAVVIAACADSTPRSTRSAKHPLIGVYDVTTTIDSFTFEGGSQCGAFVYSCAITRPTTGVFLGGTLTIGGDSVVKVDTILSDTTVHLLTPPPVRETTLVRLPVASARFVGRECARTDALGCAAYTDTLRADYTVVLQQIETPESPGDQRRFTLRLSTAVPTPQQILEFSSTRSIGDTVWGKVRWETEELRVPPTFSGTFRAVQRQ